MGKRGENIHKRKDGRWEARILTKDFAGYSKYQSVYGKTYKEAKEKREIYLRDEKKSTNKLAKITFGEIAALWLDNRFFQQKESTKLKYCNILETHIMPSLGDLDISQMDDVLINQFLKNKKESGRLDRKGGLSNSYVKTMAIIISSVMNYAVEKELCAPMKSKIIKPPVSKKQIEVLDADTQKKFEKNLLSNNSLTALGILIALNAGLRIGEICALRWEDIDLSEKIIHVRHSIIRIQSNDKAKNKCTELVIDTPKTKTSIRDIPITTKLSTILIKAKEQSCSKFVISDKAEFVSPRSFEYRYHRILSEYEIPDINFHVLRHTFATRCVELDVDIKTLSEVLGHSNVGITLNTYVHPSFDVKRTQLEKLSAISL